MSEHEPRKQRESRTTAFLMLVSICLLVWKAMGNDISWGIVTAPLWGRIIYLVIVEALDLNPEERD